MIMLINYGMGNLMSVQYAFERLGADSFISADPSDLKKASAFVLPGVGAFGEAMKNLKTAKFIKALEDQVLGEKKPLLGICLGMQILFDHSEERGSFQGLGWIKGDVRRMVLPETYRLPHVGWNTLNIEKNIGPFSSVKNGGAFYFDHTYAVQCDPSLVLATSDYGSSINAAVKQDNIVGVQFHPEKSQNSGLRLLRGFLNFVDGKQ